MKDVKVYPYSLDGIKRFDVAADNNDIEVACPKCGAALTYPLDHIEYPNPIQVLDIECACGYNVRVTFDIDMFVKISNVEVK